MEMPSVLLTLCDDSPDTEQFLDGCHPMRKCDVFFVISMNKLSQWRSYDVTANKSHFVNDLLSFDVT